ncbi:MAG: DUF5678 domain-containing protein [Solirubrobacteraceae bacterium]
MSEPRRGVHPPAIGKALSEELVQYRGRWVAIHEQRVIADSDSLHDVIVAAERQGVLVPLTFRVPTHPERTWIL